MKKKKSVFYRIYFFVVIIFLVVLAVGLVVLYGWLKSYESSQPTTIVNKIITDYLEKGDYEGLQKDLELKVSEFDSSDNLNGILKEAVEGKKYSVAHSSFKPEGADLAYIIKADDEKVLNVYLKKHKIGKGYDIAYAELSKSLLKTIEIIAPKGAEITVNGVAVPDDLKKDNEFPSLPSTIDVKTLTPTQTAKISGLLSDSPVVEATINGKKAEITANGTTFTVAQPIDKAVGDKVTDIAQKCAVAYAAYMQKDGSFGAFSQHCDTSTPFYKNVASSLVMFVKPHNGYKNENLTVTALTKYSDSLYSCRVTFKHTLLSGDTTYSDDFDKIVFVSKNKDVYKVIDMQAPVSNSDTD